MGSHLREEREKLGAKMLLGVSDFLILSLSLSLSNLSGSCEIGGGWRILRKVVICESRSETKGRDIGGSKLVHLLEFLCFAKERGREGEVECNRSEVCEF